MTEQALPPMRATHDWPTPAGSWAYDTWGRHGRPVVLLPAILFERHCWWPVAADLRPHASVIAVDLPGHGGSARRHRYAPDTLVDDLAALIAHLAITQAPVIVGHASSAALAALFATRYATHAVITVDADPAPPPITTTTCATCNRTRSRTATSTWPPPSTIPDCCATTPIACTRGRHRTLRRPRATAASPCTASHHQPRRTGTEWAGSARCTTCRAGSPR